MKSKTPIEVKSKSTQKVPKVAIIILNWNGWKDTIECLESVFRNTYPNYQVIVVDNGSTDDSMEKIKAWADGKQEVLTPESTHPLYHLSHPAVVKPIPYIYYAREEAEKGGNFELEEKLTKEWQGQRKANSKELTPTSTYPLIFIQTGENLGCAGGNNVGTRYSLTHKYDYILFLNNDTIVSSDFLKPLVEVCIQSQNIGMVGPKIYYYAFPDTIHSAGGRINLWLGKSCHIGILEKDIGQYNKKCSVDFLTGCALLVSKKVCDTVGLFDENFFLYFEDVDWCLRTRLSGKQLIYVPLSHVWHHKRIFKWSFDDSIARFYMTRNQIYFIYKYGKWYHWLVFIWYYFFSTIKTIAAYIIKGHNWTGVRSTILGVIDGFKLIFRGDKKTKNE
ncbi:MAG: glycosyltransferase family 2 protein [Candidatus Atribacteria bacterium]|nr:glycosyltransferase family 2 protein [Candidatus Atribacteria bacterium]